MKKILFLIILLFSISPVCQAEECDSISARDSRIISRYQKNRTMRGLKTFVDIGYQWGIDDNDDCEPFCFWTPFDLDKIQASASIGKQFNNFVFFGVGLGCDVFFGNNKVRFGVPIYGDLRINMLNDKRVMPFIDLRLGYSFGQIDGVYMCGQIGVRYRLTHKYAISLAYQYDLSINTVGDFDNDIGVNNCGFKIGFEF